MNNLLSLWQLLSKKNKLYFFLFVMLIIIQAFFEILSIAIVIPFVTLLLDPGSLNNLPFINLTKLSLNFENTQKTIILLSIIFFTVFLIKNIIIATIYKFLFDYVYNFRRTLSTKILKKYLYQDYIFFIKHPYSVIASNLANEVNNLTTNFFRPSLIIFGELVILFLIIILIILSGYAKGFLLIAPFVALSAVILKLLSKKIKSWANNRVKNVRNLTRLTYEIILGIKEIFLTGKIKEILNKYNLFQKESSNIDSKVQLVQTFPKLLLELFAILVFLITLIYLSLQNIDNKEIIVILSFYLALAYRIMPSLNKIFLHYQQLKVGRPSLNIIKKDINLTDKLYYFDNNNLQKLEFKNKIEFKNIKFQFENRKELFSNLNFTLLKNEIVGIYGESGSGKSTLLNILSLLIKPIDCEISIDEKKLYDKEDFRRYQNLISFVSQDTFLLEDTIKNNITFGSDGEIDNKKLNDALEFARINNFLDELPNGLETLIGLNSKQISSGQKQRIAIARLFYNSREILIFDEATNALDESNETIITNNILNFKDQKTIIIVSHNKKNLINCDKIYQVKDNSIVQEK